MRILILLNLILIFLSCKNSDTDSKIELDYCKMLELDQSYVNSDTTDRVKQNSDRLKRHNLIKNNFKDLIQYSSQNGFPEMGSLKATGIDSCRNWAVFITIFHIGQIEPKLLFEDETINVFKNEIENGNLKSSSIFSSIRDGFRDHEFC